MSLCPSRHLYSLCPGRHPGLFSLWDAGLSFFTLFMWFFGTLLFLLYLLAASLLALTLWAASSAVSSAIVGFILKFLFELTLWAASSAVSSAIVGFILKFLFESPPYILIMTSYTKPYILIMTSMRTNMSVLGKIFLSVEYENEFPLLVFI